ncbi:transglutaminase-like domain-containing protein [Streptomyces sp. NBC_00038]|uniref:transglutaminase-like domain-containing protein n=1 Tax=Streptomyces sp. NBC_00038 TaxID=2903615 RepID=UPI0022520356|nr:transglutaminase-like domain-containing protein [Streptomyces sp. NBC_00038]MCX5561586.1 transglutaminase-like domain-containing protein [Streptomyces sp. NBC_00038]
MDLYLTQSAYSDPGDLDTGDLPRDPGRLAHLVRELIIHRLEGWRFGHVIPDERLHVDAEARYVTELLRILRERRDAPLTRPRAPGERFVGTCRDFSLLLCSLLRATGTPARIRGGFATYFIEGFHEDHWITEYTTPDGSWRLVDAQVLHESYDVPFDPLDVPRDRFLMAGEAWRACRTGELDFKTFGFSGAPELSGMWFLRARVLQDLAALHGVEPLPWDGWGPEILDDASLTEDDLALIDAVADARSEDELRRLYQDPRLTVPDEITSYTTYGGNRKVTLRQRSAPPA